MKFNLYSIVPPTGLVILAIVAIQVGSGLAVNLFPLLGAEGTVATRIVFSSILLLLFAGNRVFTYGRTFLDNKWLLLAFGLTIAMMNFCFYQALDRIPLGAAVAFEFIGPLSLAALTSRQWVQFVWVAIAAVGIVLLSPLSGNDLQASGVIFALMAGACWAAFILLAGKIGERVQGNDGLTIAMVISALIMIPYALPVAGVMVGAPWLLAGGFALALLSTAIPLTFEFQALRKISARRYGILVSLEPAVAVLAGALLLKERLGYLSVFAIACVIIAAVGITLSERNNSASEDAA